MKYQNKFSDKFIKVLDENSNSIKVTFSTNNNLLKQINYGLKHFLHTIMLEFKT